MGVVRADKIPSIRQHNKLDKHSDQGLFLSLSLSLSLFLFLSLSLTIGIYDFFPTARAAFIGIYKAAMYPDLS